RQFMFMRVANNLAHARQRSDLFRCALRITSGDYDLAVRILAVNPSNGSSCVLIRRRCDRTGIEHNDFRFRGNFSGPEPELQELALNCSPVGLRGATTKVLYIERAHRTIVAVRSSDPGRWFAPSCSHPQRRCTLKRRILLVDDDLAVLLTLKAVLELHEFE